ncbi:MAG TPA: hypothetical protein VMI33_12365 [Streptosporangiaceae bacterium]|nr:hypothetical protein [Streptosporangiaceae bacterium]
MDAKTQASPRRGASAGRAEHNGERRDHQPGQPGAGIDLPVFGHVEYRSAGFMAGLGLAGALGAIEWPVAAAVGIGYVLARRG